MIVTCWPTWYFSRPLGERICTVWAGLRSRFGRVAVGTQVDPVAVGGRFLEVIGVRVAGGHGRGGRLQLEIVVGAVIADDLLQKDGAGQDRVVGVIGQSDGYRRACHCDEAELLVNRLADPADPAGGFGARIERLDHKPNLKHARHGWLRESVQIQDVRLIPCRRPIVDRRRSVAVREGTSNPQPVQYILSAGKARRDRNRIDRGTQRVADLQCTLIIDDNAAVGHGEGCVARGRIGRLPARADLVGRARGSSL